MVDLPVVSFGSPADNRVLDNLPENLIKENGGGFGFVMIWQGDNSYQWRSTVGAFLCVPEHQKGTWLIDGGWGGPPGPIHVRWNGVSWESGGYCGVDFEKSTQIPG